MSKEIVQKTLINLGVKELDAEIYVFLAQTGPQKGRNIVDVLQIGKQQVYCSLKTLCNKRMVNVTHERPARFSAVPLENILDSLIEAKKEEAQRVEQNRDEILSSWQSMLMENVST